MATWTRAELMAKQSATEEQLLEAKVKSARAPEDKGEQMRVQLLEERLAKLDAALDAKLFAAEPAVATPPAPSTGESREDRLLREQERVARINMVDAVEKKIGKFDAGMEVSKFLMSANNVFKLNVVPCPGIEKDFVLRLKGCLSDDFQTTLLNSGEKTDTFATFEAYMKKTFASKVSGFQLAYRLVQSKMRPEESYMNFAHRLETLGVETDAAIALKYEQAQDAVKGEQKGQAAETVTMTRHQFRKMIEGAVLLHEIAIRDADDCNYVTPYLDQCWSATDIATRATEAHDRKQEVGNGAAAVANYAKPREQSRGQSRASATNSSPVADICEFLVKFGNCKFESKPGRSGHLCRKDHDRDRAERFRRTFGVEVKAADNKEKRQGGGARRGGRGHNRGQGRGNGSSQGAFATAAEGSAEVASPENECLAGYVVPSNQVFRH